MLRGGLRRTGAWHGAIGADGGGGRVLARAVGAKAPLGEHGLGGVGGAAIAGGGGGSGGESAAGDGRADGRGVGARADLGSAAGLGGAASAAGALRHAAAAVLLHRAARAAGVTGSLGSGLGAAMGRGVVSAQLPRLLSLRVVAAAAGLLLRAGGGRVDRAAPVVGGVPGHRPRHDHGRRGARREERGDLVHDLDRGGDLEGIDEHRGDARRRRRRPLPAAAGPVAAAARQRRPQPRHAVVAVGTVARNGPREPAAAAVHAALGRLGVVGVGAGRSRRARRALLLLLRGRREEALGVGPGGRWHLRRRRARREGGDGVAERGAGGEVEQSGVAVENIEDLAGDARRRRRSGCGGGVVAHGRALQTRHGGDERLSGGTDTSSLCAAWGAGLHSRAHVREVFRARGRLLRVGLVELAARRLAPRAQLPASSRRPVRAGLDLEEAALRAGRGARPVSEI